MYVHGEFTDGIAFQGNAGCCIAEAFAALDASAANKRRRSRRTIAAARPRRAEDDGESSDVGEGVSVDGGGGSGREEAELTLAEQYARICSLEDPSYFASCAEHVTELVPEVQGGTSSGTACMYSSTPNHNLIAAAAAAAAASAVLLVV